MPDYGDAANVASLTPRHANASGVFDGTTRPTITYVSTMLTQVSAALNSILAEYGFSTPITADDSDDVKYLLDLFANEEVAAMVEGINGSGRFGPTTKAPHKRGRWAVIMDDARSFVDGQAIGFERLGCTRTQPQLYGLTYRQYDESGDEVVPLTQREGFGEDYVNWDK